MQKQIASGKERETKMESAITELSRKVAESNRIITRRVCHCFHFTLLYFTLLHFALLLLLPIPYHFL
jgi:hypothetical protein